MWLTARQWGVLFEVRHLMLEPLEAELVAREAPTYRRRSVRWGATPAGSPFATGRPGSCRALLCKCTNSSSVFGGRLPVLKALSPWKVVSSLMAYYRPYMYVHPGVIAFLHGFALKKSYSYRAYI